MRGGAGWPCRYPGERAGEQEPGAASPWLAPRAGLGAPRRRRALREPRFVPSAHVSRRRAPLRSAPLLRSITTGGGGGGGIAQRRVMAGGAAAGTTGTT